MSEKCFMCGIETSDQLVRSPLPKELLDKGPDGQLLEDLQPICESCDNFKKNVDNNFVRLCEENRLFEWYRSNSKKRSEYFPPEFVYNIDVEELREFYYMILSMCEKAYRVASNDVARDNKRENLNYEWRKKDD